MHHLQGLNDRQKEAVEHTEGPLLIIAGAGAGKTRVITHRILHLIKKGVPPESILAITFTNKAAKEMRNRVSHLLNLQLTTHDIQQHADSSSSVPSRRWSVVSSPFISTFHSLGVHILKENSRRLGFTRNFTIFDKGDSLRAIKESLKRSSRDPKNFEPGKMLGIISREKGNMVPFSAFAEKAGGEYLASVVAEVWKYYEEILREENALDFDDLLLKTALLLTNEKEIREHYQRIWKYIHIDEYQDTNHVQYRLSRLLSEKDRNIAVVGDIDQNIYSWRGANIKNILNFEKDYPEAKVLLLEENYRSTQTILTVANRIIEKNRVRREKTLFTKNGDGEKIGLFSGYDETEEALFVARKAKSLIGNKVEPKEIAVLFRANFQSRALEEAFIREEVPYQVLGVRFFERKEVKDMLSYLRAARTTLPETDLNGQALNPTEGLSDIKRIINVPARGIGKVTLLKIFAGGEAKLPAGVKEKVVAFRKLLKELAEKLKTEPLSQSVKWILRASGLEAELKRGGDEDLERLENLRELVTVAARYDLPAHAGGEQGRLDAVEKFLIDAALQSDQDELKEEQNKVRLMTVHASKGLEFEYVFITGLEEGLFPHERLNQEKIDESAAEEERRLFYVAVTRAKKKVFLSYAGVRTVFGSRQVTVPSEFVFDVDEEFIAPEEPIEGGKVIFFD